ncbi:permease of the major facilitator superfamily [Aquitalea magnusonii]|uniref:Permease of the major facilitator superfamily n=1 Tax=Aquitalea magnusonii TaxID=332411 RepID=A0A3G9GE48_9NEIS|nr:MFS transporter [Aquitalea magnusonii]BBF84939.1 permease of the major facilitator superfamily [Aquitalea magnusonii]
MITSNSKRALAALMLAHCAGMIDLVALPIWVGTLVAHYHFDPMQAGLLASLFLGGAVLASAVLAPYFNPDTARWQAAIGFSLSALLFAVAAQTSHYLLLAALHALCGITTGMSLSVTHGTIARGSNPHRGFALVGIALGVFAILFLGAAPPVVASLGGPVLFYLFAGVMAVGALACALAFPRPESGGLPRVTQPRQPVPRQIWYGIVGIACMGLVQSMTFSFLERVGSDRGFGLNAVTGVLIALGFVNLLPAPLAALLEKRLPARTVLMAGPLVQALLVVVIMTSVHFAPYAAAASVFAAVMIFTHTFAFGLMARLDRSGRAMAATPAMLMTGAAIGPILGGTLVQGWGYASLGPVTLVLGVAASFCFSRLPRSSAVQTQEALA